MSSALYQWLKTCHYQ